MCLFKKTVVVFIVLLISSLAYGVVSNNCCQSEVDSREVAEAHEQAVQWLIRNKEDFMDHHNLILWWMIGEAAKISGDKRLEQAFLEYKRLSFAVYSISPLRYLIDGVNPETTSDIDLYTYRDYQAFLIYALTCDESLLGLDTLSAQLDTSFCRKTHPITPACATHHMMGFRFMERTACGNASEIERKLQALSKTVRNQMIFDFRVVDAYLQRVMMLLDAGNGLAVKPIWIKNIIDAQLPDGGWSDFHPIIKISDHSYVGFTRNALGIRAEYSDIHTTAQGILLTSLWLEFAKNKAKT